MRIVLFGGAFDPPHLGHQQVANSLIQTGLADEVWLVPVKIHSFAKNMSASEHRLKMLELISSPKIKIETYEMTQSGINYTFNTLDALTLQYPQHQFSWVIGSDNLAKFHLWGDKAGRDFRALLRVYHFYVYPRHGFPFEPLYENMTPLTNLPEVTVSSTEVRQLVASNKSLTGFVAPVVADYIENHQLYQAQDKILSS